MEWWKVIIAPLLVAAIVGVASFFFGRATAPDVASVEAEVKWIDVQNPMSSMPAALADLDKYIQANFKIPGASNLVAKLRFNSMVRIYVLTLSNDTAVRSKSIEVATGQDSFLISNDALQSQPEISSRLQIKQLDPGGKAIVYAISAPYLFSNTSPLHVLHDDRKVEIRQQTIPSESDPIVRFVQNNSYLAAPLFMVFLGFGILLVLGIPFGIAINYSQEFRAKNTSKKEALKLKAFVEYLQQNHPDKLSPT